MSQKIVYSDEEDNKPKKQRKPLSDEQKNALRERLAKAREAKKNKRECRMTSLPQGEQLKAPDPSPEPVKEEEDVVKEPLTKPAKRSYKKKDIKNDEVVEKVEKKMEEHLKTKVIFDKTSNPIVTEEEKPKRKYVRKPKITIPNPF